VDAVGRPAAAENCAYASLYLHGKRPRSPFLAMRLAGVWCEEATAEAANTSCCRSGMTETWQLARPAPETAGRAIKRRGYGSRASLATALKRASPGASLRPSLIRLGEAWSTSHSSTLCASVLFLRPGFLFYQSLFLSLLYPVFAQSFAVASHSFPLHSNHPSGPPRPPKLGASPPSPANTLRIS
jgi:hypothetical protein